LAPPQAEKLANQNGLLVEVEDRFYSAEVPEGHILSQIPPPGTKVRRGWHVRLSESLGMQHVVIPDVVGQSPRAAEINLRRRGLEPGTIAYAHIPGQPPEQVIAQSPPPAAVGVASPKVNLLLAAPTDPPAFVMPNFVGRTLADAARAIQQAGLKLAAAKTSASPASPGPAAPGDASPASPSPGSTAPAIVIRQSPAAGAKVLAGATVELEVSN
jgi:beta-lactam-binding protein with PASTA domain